MAFYAGALVRDPAMANPTIVVLTDRNDLDDQLFGTFARCQDLLRQAPVQAAKRADLRKKLAVQSGGVVFTTIQKFLPEERGDRHPVLSNRRNVVVIADEAHRSQYDFIDGFARHMRDALPQASFVGFTGTPVESGDRHTRAVFGDYISIYDVQRAVEDRATVPIYYENRLARLSLDEAERPRIDPGLRGSHRRRGGGPQGAAEDQVGATRSGGGRRAAHRVGRQGHRRALREPHGSDGRQGDDRVHEPPHLHRPPSPVGGAAARLAPGRRRQGRHEGGDDRGGLRPARLAAAHPQQAAPGGAGQSLPRPRRPLPGGHRARHVAHRLRRPEPAHHVRGQAHARPRADAGHRAGQPGVQGQAGRPGGGLSGPRECTPSGARHLHRERRHRPNGPRPERGGGVDAGEARGSAAPCSTASIGASGSKAGRRSAWPCCRRPRSTSLPRKAARSAA